MMKKIALVLPSLAEVRSPLAQHSLLAYLMHKFLASALRAPLY
jgi:hypothetical protein